MRAMLCSRMAYVAGHDPGLYARTRHVLLPKDYCARKLTGETATDPISSVGLVDADLRYIADLFALVPGAIGRVAPAQRFLGPGRRGAPGAPLRRGAGLCRQ